MLEHAMETPRTSKEFGALGKKTASLSNVRVQKKIDSLWDFFIFSLPLKRPDAYLLKKAKKTPTSPLEW